MAPASSSPSPQSLRPSSRAAGSMGTVPSSLTCHPTGASCIQPPVASSQFNLNAGMLQSTGITATGAGAGSQHQMQQVNQPQMQGVNQPQMQGVNQYHLQLVNQNQMQQVNQNQNHQQSTYPGILLLSKG